MLSRVGIVTLASLLQSTAHADYYLYWQDGSVMYLPDEIVLFAAVLVFAVCVGVIYGCIENASSSSSSVARMSLDLPKEVGEPESVEYYDEITARTHALKQKLDADTELAESYIKAARARAALDDLDESSASRRTNTASR